MHMKYADFGKNEAMIGARDRNRTGTGCLTPQDFKSCVSTYFTTRAFMNERIKMEAGVGIEPASTALQAAA